MKMRKLISTKPHRYGTRHLTAGDEYEAPPRHAVALVAARKARFAPDKKPAIAVARPVVEASGAKAPQQAEPVADTAEMIDSLRLQATQLGINVDGRWGVARLQHEIAQARG